MVRRIRPPVSSENKNAAAQPRLEEKVYEAEQRLPKACAAEGSGNDVEGPRNPVSASSLTAPSATQFFAGP